MCVVYADSVAGHFDNDQLADMAQNGWAVLPDNATAVITDAPVEDEMYSGYCGPSKTILASCESPLDVFYYFLPKSFWRQVASLTNLCWNQTFDARLEKAIEKEIRVTHRTQRSPEKLRRNLMKFMKILPHEIVQWIGLMLAHALSPRKRLDMHWFTQEKGVLPSGTFGRVMARDRFREISRFLHFTDNTAPAVTKDRAWKIRGQLKEGYVLRPRVAIDEEMLRGEWVLQEVDVGRKNDGEGAQSMDTKSDPAAVVRNVPSVFRGMPYEGRRLVTTDRFYTSIPLAQQLRTMGFNFVGTIQIKQRGWCKQVEFPFKKRPSTVRRCEFKMAVAESNPGLVAVGWADNKDVYFLGSQVSVEPTTVQRREKNGSVTIVPCPALVAEYQRYMGGVDRHDQLRLQSYSMQLSTRFVKYY
ncbi:hypothetical protein PHMEG_00026043 [Phytophthora megakarya]|uniref:PiggyBac transposable element-derived protein domain-containing protein n=1 Tax=Phytophthora megakarya TaxID=4795 RepID=A0A225VC07_9STRA|nr:hypothetical protein PHMEG_00026043 [Phytophthora megakarya]